MLLLLITKNQKRGKTYSDRQDCKGNQNSHVLLSPVFGTFVVFSVDTLVPADGTAGLFDGVVGFQLECSAASVRLALDYQVCLGLSVRLDPAVPFRNIYN